MRRQPDSVSKIVTIGAARLILVFATVCALLGPFGCSGSQEDSLPSPGISEKIAESIDLLSRFTFLDGVSDQPSELAAKNIDCLDSSSGCEYVDIRGDRRRAIRIESGGERSAFATMPTDARLRFSFAPLGADSQIEVTVAAGAGQTLSRTFDVPVQAQWHDVELVLGEFAGEECAISASAKGGGAIAFAMPRIITVPQNNVVPGRQSVLLYLIDTLRADHLSAYGYDRATTPFLEELGERGYVYLNSYSTSAWTRPSTATLLTGLFPSFHQANARMRLPLEVSTVAEVMRAGGWSTWAFVTNGNVNAAGLDFEQGFDRFVAIKPRGNQPDASEINDLVVPWLEEVGDEPFFLFIHSVDPHAPYNPPESVRFRFTDPEYDGPVIPEETRKKYLGTREPTDDDLAYIIGLYDEEILFQDSMIRELFDALKNDRLMERTYTVITSDHGEEFFEHGYWEHGKKLFEEQIRVPLIVIPPSTKQVEPARITLPVQGVDVVPSIFGWLGIDFAAGLIQGDVLPLSDRDGVSSRPVYCEEIRHDSGFDIFSLAVGSQKIIVKKNRERGGQKIWLFNLAEDPYEQNNLYSRDSEQALDLMQRLENFSSTELTGKPAQSIPEPSLEQDAIDQLKALGYIE
jgi:arylsulfatase A-like enzyme